jgi:imidazoleglycerol phosphate synthase glutamine amidotransferase subunit HisH
MSIAAAQSTPAQAGAENAPQIAIVDLPLSEDPPDPIFLYHVHCFAPHPVEEDVILGTAQYGESFPAVVGRGDIHGAQPHSAHGVAPLADFARACATRRSQETVSV